MSTNILESVQYRTNTVSYANVTPSKGWDMFDLFQGGGWEDVPVGKTSFPTNTQFRMKPEMVYKLHEGASYRTFANRSSLMVEINKKLDAGDTVSVSSGEQTSTKHSNPLLQVFDGVKWASVNISGQPAVFAYAANFRLRPDHYHKVVTQDSLVKGEIDFHDIDKLAAYVDKRLRTNGLDFSVKKVKYT